MALACCRVTPKWSEWDVTEEEYRRNAKSEDVAHVDDLLKESHL